MLPLSFRRLGVLLLHVRWTLSILRRWWRRNVHLTSASHTLLVACSRVVGPQWLLLLLVSPTAIRVLIRRRSRTITIVRRRSIRIVVIKSVPRSIAGMMMIGSPTTISKVSIATVAISTIVSIKSIGSRRRFGRSGSRISTHVSVENPHKVASKITNARPFGRRQFLNSKEGILLGQHADFALDFFIHFFSRAKSRCDEGVQSSINQWCQSFAHGKNGRTFPAGRALLHRHVAFNDSKQVGSLVPNIRLALDQESIVIFLQRVIRQIGWQRLQFFQDRALQQLFFDGYWNSNGGIQPKAFSAVVSLCVSFRSSSSSSTFLGCLAFARNFRLCVQGCRSS
mmetsp:Transcript_22795/g.63374  ORF Transcript_22795/g.63374 Transcript_22795/m.63374 type:complete len:339 (+) Transcript_22795:5565-6581(+)